MERTPEEAYKRMIERIEIILRTISTTKYGIMDYLLKSFEKTISCLKEEYGKDKPYLPIYDSWENGNYSAYFEIQEIKEIKTFENVTTIRNTI